MATKVPSLLFLLLVLAHPTKAQRNNNWIIGNGVNIKKSRNSVSTQPVPSFRAFEGCGTVSNQQTGELLFYTNGVNIWNRDFALMPNGDSLASGLSSTQTGLILPIPGGESQYAVFSTPEFFSQYGEALSYSVVDMNLDNGLGNVVEGKKNVPLLSTSCEALTYTLNSDSSAYWLITHERRTNRFVSLKIDKYGIGVDTVYSPIGRKWGEIRAAEWQAYMKISPDGTKLAVSNVNVIKQPEYTTRIELYDFNRCTGKVSNEILLEGLSPSTYACEFSPNSRYLYYSNSYLPSYLYQVDVSSGVPSSIQNSTVQIAKAPTPPASQNRIMAFAGLQLHADGKIYLSETGNNALHLIETPDEKGANCNFRFNAVDFEFSRANYGLPQPVPIDLLPPSVDTPLVKITVSDSCLENNPVASISGVRPTVKREWFLADTNGDILLTSSSRDFNLEALDAGAYTLKIDLFTDCQNYSYQKPITVVECFCEGTIVLNDSCVETRSMLSVTTRYSVDSIRWLVFDSTTSLVESRMTSTFNRPLGIGPYQTKAITYFSCGTDTLESFFRIDSCFACTDVFLPNAFSPNGDGINDFFGATTLCQFDTFRLRIYNRWGTKIFEANLHKAPWDGTFRGTACPLGMYHYTVSYRAAGRPNRFKSGSVTLIR